MKGKYLYLAVFAFSIIGLFVVQYQYLRIGLNLAKVQFDKKVSMAGRNIKNDLNHENQLSFLIATAISEEKYFNIGIDSVKDASRFFLNDFLKQRLTENGVETDFNYRLYARDTTDYLYSPLKFEEDSSLLRYPIEMQGYLPAVMGKPIFLELQFKDLNSYFLSQLNRFTIPSLIFIIAIIAVMIFMLRSFYWQSNVITVTNDFINNLTHELKTPVFSIGVAAKILEEDIQENKKPILLLIRQQVERLNKHIDQVLELATFESAKKILNLEKTDLYPALLQLCMDFKALSQLEGAKFTYELAPGPYHIKAEVSHLENALNNLLDNARKYSEEPEITLMATREREELLIEIKDNGSGMTAKERERVFKKFYRVPNGNLHKVKGYGLGLSYVKEIIKRHRGSIKIESEINKGTLVKVKLPLIYAKEKV